jgi:excisionase family DNA binding protein
MRNMKKSITENTIYSTGQIAKLFGVSRGTIDHWIKSKYIKAFKLPSNHYRITKSNLQDFIKFNHIDI